LKKNRRWMDLVECEARCRSVMKY